MKKSLSLFFGFLLLFYGCKGNSTLENTVDDVSLEKLVLGNISILDKMDENLFYNYPEEVEKYSISLEVKPKNQNAVNVFITTNNEETIGSIPYYSCMLAEGTNEIKIVSSSKRDSANTKTYTIKITKKATSEPNETSSKLRVLKADGVDIIDLLNDKNVATLDDVARTKDKLSLYILPYNSSATIEVSNGDQKIERVNDNTRNVSLDFGQNNIRVVINSNSEGEKLHIIKVYREEDLSLKSFNVDGVEYCDVSTGKVGENIIRFAKEKTLAIVKIEAKVNYATITLKCNEKEIKFENGSYKVPIEHGRNAVEVIVHGKDGIRSKSQKLTFLRPFPSIVKGELLTLKADDKDVLHSLSKDNSVTLPSCNNDKATLKVEAKASEGVSLKVLNNGNEVSGDGVYNVSLNEGNNKIEVQLYKDSNLLDTYLIFITRFPAQDVPNSPSAEEVQISIVLSDGVNGSPVDGSYINILKTKDASLVKRVLVRNGKAKVNLAKNNFYDFKVEGRNNDYSQTRYAASDVISYYVDEKVKVVPIAQYPLQRVTRPAEAPIMEGFWFDGLNVKAGEETSTEQMKDVNIKVVTASPIEALSWNSPLPMLSLGFVPTDDMNKDVFRAVRSGIQSKNAGGKYESSWRWPSLYGHDLIKGDAFDVVIVLYDVANNRLEYHARFKTPNTITEDSSVTVSDFNMRFESYPTQSRIFSVGEDALTKNSSHYSNLLYFKVQRGTDHVSCIGFDIYRKCVEDGEDFRCVKHFVYENSKASSVGNTTSSYHILRDNDGELESEKTYQYKIVAFTTDDKKSVLDSSPMIQLKVPKSTSLLLEYPVNVGITKNEAKNMSYKFRLSNPKILETAKEIRLGFLISDRQGIVYYASKFKYVFDDSNGEDEIYFAVLKDAQTYDGYYIGTKYSKKRTDVTTKSVQDLIKIDKTTGVIELTKDFTSITSVSLTRIKDLIPYSEGNAYYWDILDWGTSTYTDRDDIACKIVSKESNGVTIISCTSDSENGNNAWNGRAEFNVKFD